MGFWYEINFKMNRVFMCKFNTRLLALFVFFALLTSCAVASEESDARDAARYKCKISLNDKRLDILREKVIIYDADDRKPPSELIFFPSAKEKNPSQFFLIFDCNVCAT